MALTSTPTSPTALAEALAEASARGETVAVLGGGTHGRAGRPARHDRAISTSGLRSIVDYVPEDLTITVEAGLPATELAAVLAEHGQCWPQADIRPGATVGGILAAAASGRSRLGFGPVRDSLLQAVVATGDGRLVTSGGRTVKGVAGYDLPRLAVGSHGTLGVIVEVTLKLWPVPPARGWFATSGDRGDLMDRGQALRAQPARPSAIVLHRQGLSVELSGPPEDVMAPDGFEVGDEPAPLGAAGLVEVGVSPAALLSLVRELDEGTLDHEAQIGVGTCLVAVQSADDVQRTRAAAIRLGGHATLRDGPDLLREDPWGPEPAGLDIMRRLRAAFDPAGILNPGRFVGAET